MACFIFILLDQNIANSDSDEEMNDCDSDEEMSDNDNSDNE